MTIHITDTQYLQQQIGTLVGKTALVDKSNNADAFSKTLQQVVSALKSAPLQNGYLA